MYLYHGTPADFDVPTLNKCKPHRDFGCGFYLDLLTKAKILLEPTVVPAEQ